MRILLGQLAPVPGDIDRNVERVVSLLGSAPCDLAVFPELFLSGYRIGDRVHRLALSDGSSAMTRLSEAARSRGTAIVVGAPLASSSRAGEVHNAALLVRPDGGHASQVKRYLPTFGPFEEGVQFTPSDRSTPVPLGSVSLGLEVCYDVFFPEVSRDLALAGADLLIVISASPVTSRRLFERLLPARAIENAVPVVYVNRVGVEDGVVFGGGSEAWSPRGEPIAGTTASFESAAPEESATLIEIDPAEAAHWRPFRPVLRDIAGRPGSPEGRGSPSGVRSIPTRPL